LSLTDSTERGQATDPTQSFIVQAPAGSGKTELLTQRYLRLLACVQEPEQIVALTFTRKAANEMRERILKSLQLAAKNTQATSAHQQQTLEIAQQALNQDKAQQWHLLNQPSRLRIMTIDALCQTINNAIPLQEKQIAYAQITDRANLHYHAAALSCLNFAIEHPDFQKPITVLLKHLDNHQNKLLDLFQQLLATRSEWLQPIFQAKSQEKAHYELALSIIEQHELKQFATIPEHLQTKLTQLARSVALIEGTPQSPRYNLCEWHTFASLNRTFAASLACLLLTSQNTLRKSFDHHVGLKRDRCEKEEFSQLKEASKLLLEQLSELPDFLNALLRVKQLPDPHYNVEQWDVLQALFTLLPLLVAHLNILFNEQNEVDFTAISQQALEALGDETCPTDLALYLDNRIHHLLIDEFQDTSIQQFDLITRLVQGWQHNDGRTLFVVGDPMQSIYRFRSAEVGLFLRAQQNGIGPVALTTLKLTTNFRSTETIIQWVNHQFKSIFPTTDDIESGAIRFHPSTHIQPAIEQSYIKAQAYQSPAQEAQGIAEIVQLELDQNPEDSIAILVRSRGQLTHIIAELRERRIPFQGVEIDLLAKLPHLRDVWSLTQALLMPANRLPWLAFLRSPWCGFTLTDLHYLANYSKKKSLLYALSHHKKNEYLSTEGHTRAEFIYNVLNHALACRYQKPLVDWLMHTLKQLHLEHILNHAEQDDLEQYWKLLARFESAGQLDNMTQFKSAFNTLFSQQVTPSRLQIMTIHKSKGLEFDSVILPGLSKKPPVANKPLIRWLKLPQQTAGELLLLSPIKAAHHEQCKVYDFLGKLDSVKSQYEMQRLFYVAVTRTKKRLILTDNTTTQTSNSFRSLLIKPNFIDIESPNDAAQNEEDNLTLPTSHHLDSHYYQSQEPIKPHHARPVIKVHNNLPRLTGILAHELLQWIGTTHPNSIHDIPWTLVTHQMKAMGIIEQAPILSQLKLWITQLFDDPTGQWLMREHEQERNEYEILISESNTLCTRIVDRTFCEKGIRWVIDFKTGEETTLKMESYRKQVNEYAKHLTSLYQQPIQCGLYFLATNRWVTWSF